ncbi:hypothetical protein MSG28_016182, partial [Choristoneura fumiferana]
MAASGGACAYCSPVSLMSVNNFGDVHPLSSGSEDVESPRKRMQIESPVRKSWSLTDRKTDQEHKPNLKRKYDIENVNPNVNSITSPRSKHSPRSPRAKICSPSPGPSKAKSPRSLEKDEETPLGQSVALAPGRGYLPSLLSPGASSYGTGECTPISELTLVGELPGMDSFSVLSDEMMLSVFRIVARLPVIVRLAGSEISSWHPTSPPETSRIQYLDLSMSSIDPQTLDCLLARCGNLRKLSLESLDVSDCSRLGARAVLAAAKLPKLEHLALSRCYLLPPHVL